MPQQQPTRFENINPTDPIPNSTTSPITEDGELLLYGLQGMLAAVALDMKVTPRGEPQGTPEALRYLFSKDQDRARMVHDCLYMARVLLEEATALVDAGIDWKTIEALYCPTEDDFIDCPAHWFAIAQAAQQEAGQEAGQQKETGAVHCSVPNRAPPIAPEFVVPPAPEVVAPQTSPAAPEPSATPQPVRRASKGALRSLGRELRTELEHEKRRFYAIAQEHGLPTHLGAGDAIRAALSELLGEPIASRRQLTARQWSLAASSIETEDLFWEAPAPKRQPRATSRAQCEKTTRETALRP